MGRHRLPDPDEPNGDDSATERLRFPFRPQPEEPQQPPTEAGYGDFTEPDYGPGFGAPDADEQYGDFAGRDYPDSGYAEQDFGDDYRDDFGDRSYRDPEYSDAGGADFYSTPSYGTEPDDTGPDYTGSDYTEPDDIGPPATGRQRTFDADTGEWTGSHRAVAGKRRGVSVGVIAALVGVIILVTGFVGWQFFGDALSNRTGAAAARCVAGDLNISVLADPSIAEQTQTLADSYNEGASQVGDKCVQVSVRGAEPGQVVDGFRGEWPTDLGDQPALWIPASSASEAQLEVAAGAQTIDDSRSLVSSPVVLAVRPELKDALGQQNWSALPNLQSNPAALDELGLQGWGALKLALPQRGDADAADLAAEAIAAAAAPAGEPATAGLGAVNTVLAGQPELADDAWSTAMDALVDSTDPATAPVHAVVATEQQLYQRGIGLDDAEGTLAAWRPAGPTAVADYPTVLLSGTWLGQEEMAAASEFARFMRRPEQLTELAAAGFRTDTDESPDSGVVDFAAPVSDPLTIDDAEARVTVADAVASPAAGAAVTIMLDRSMTETEGDNTRMGNAVNALIDRMSALPPTAAVGLWTFDGVAGTSVLTLGPLSEPVGDQLRAEALTATLDAQSSTGGGTVSFTTLRLVYTDATTNYREGQPNSVLVITGGPHTDRTLDGPGLQAFIEQTFNPERPVAVNILDFGEDSDGPTWQAVAEATGGSHLVLPTSNSPELDAAIARLLG